MAANDRSVAPDPRSLKRLRLVLWLVVLALAVAAVVVYVAVRPSRRAGTAVPVSATPAATWAAGELRAPAFRLQDAKHLNDVANAFPADAKPAIVAVSVNVYGNAPRVLEQDVRKWQLVPQWRWGIGSSGQLSRVWGAYNIQVLVSSKKIAGIGLVMALPSTSKVFPVLHSLRRRRVIR